MNKLFAIAFGIFLLTGCGSTQIISKPEFYTITPYDPPKVEPTVQHPVIWHVITAANADQVIKDLESQEGTVVLFAVTPDTYSNLSLNDADLRRFIQEQGKVIVGMDQYYRKESIAQKPDASKGTVSSPTTATPAPKKSGLAKLKFW